MAALPPSPAPPFCASGAAVFERPVAANESRRNASARADRNARPAFSYQPQTRAALSGVHDDIAHRLARLDRFMRGGDLAEIEGLRHVVDELATLQHARDVGGCAGGRLRGAQCKPGKISAG